MLLHQCSQGVGGTLYLQKTQLSWQAGELKLHGPSHTIWRPARLVLLRGKEPEHREDDNELLQLHTPLGRGFV